MQNGLAMDNTLTIALALSTLAALSVPIGAWLGSLDRMYPNWLQDEARHSVAAFGGGALLSAIALVLVPDGAEHLPGAPAVFAFVAGGIIVFVIDRAIQKSGGKMAQLLAMLLDFVPEAMALGALLSGDVGTAILLAALIALQNLPESFNAFREMQDGDDRRSSKWLLLVFVLIVPIGPLSAWLGVAVLADAKPVLGGCMLMAAGGIVYLLFEDVAPQVRLERSWGPPLGAVAGFALGFSGDLIIG